MASRHAGCPVTQRWTLDILRDVYHVNSCILVDFVMSALALLIKYSNSNDVRLVCCVDISVSFI